MARYIDVDKLIAEYDRVHIGAPGGARKLMVDAPTADVVEVVRCKDCKYNAFVQPNGTIHCHAKRNLTCEFRSPYDFCSYGERKE